jgi:hypothetical protein
MKTMVVALALVGLLQAGPVILSSDDIGDNYYDAPPAVLSGGAATTLSQFIDLGGEKREAEFRLGRRPYRIRLQSKEPDESLANPPLQRTWSSLTLGTTPLNGQVVSRTKPIALHRPH